MDIKRLTSQLYEIFDFMLSNIEERERKLKDLLKEVDTKISTLERLLREKELKSQEADFLDRDEARQIISAYNDGRTVRDIARHLNIPSGEVELIINLYRAKNEGCSNR